MWNGLEIHPMRKVDFESISARQDEARSKIFARARADGLPFDGLNFARLLSEISDQAIVDFYLGSARADESESAPMSIVALGGYGKRYLNPYSDVDLLFLIADPRGQSWIGRLLGGLWDLGLMVSHLTGAIEELIDLARSDHRALSSMLKARLIIGDEPLYRKFRSALLERALDPRRAEFIDSKLNERIARLEKYGPHPHLNEPNLKESPGGARAVDFADSVGTALWGAFDAICDQAPIDGAPSAREARAAFSDLMAARSALHLTLDRKSDLLDRASQLHLARSSRYEGSLDEKRIELMRVHFKSAVALFALEETIAEAAKTALRKSLHLGAIETIEPDRPLYEKLFEIAREMSRRPERAPSRAARARLEKEITNRPESLFVGVEAGEFLESILALDRSADFLRLARDIGLLRRLIPEFGAIEGLIGRDVAHRFTVDEHTIATIEALETIPRRSNLDASFRSLYQALDSKVDLKLALLCHDLGKADPSDDHSELGERAARSLLGRLELDRHSESVRYLIWNHLLMSLTAMRRDYAEKSVFLRFARQIPNRALARKLYLLTFADIAGVAPGFFSAFKESILLQLYRQTENYFTFGEKIFRLTDEDLKSLVSKIALGSDARSIATVYEALKEAPKRYIRDNKLEHIRADIKALRALDKEPIAIRYRLKRRSQTGKIIVAARDRIGLFAIIAGACASFDIAIVKGVGYSFKVSGALDVFTISGAFVAALTERSSQLKLESTLRQLLTGAISTEELMEKRARYSIKNRRDALDLAPLEILVLNHLSDQTSVLEVCAPNQIDTLYLICSRLARLNINIRSAKISVEGPRAVNVFHVVDPNGAKIEDRALIDSIRAELLEALS